MNGLNGATQAQVLAQFPQSEVALFGQKSPHLSTVGGPDHGFASGKTMTRRDVAGMAALLEKLFDHAQRNTKPEGNLVASALVVVVGLQDSLSQIQRKCCHAQGLP